MSVNSNGYIHFGGMIRNITILLLLSLSFGQFQPQTTEELQEAVDLWVFDNDSALSTYGEINTWDVSLIDDMSELFRDKSTFNDDIGNWDVSGVTTMYRMFWSADSFNQDLSSWDVSGVTTMFEMFWSASSFNQDLSSWDVSGVTYMDYMFEAADALSDGNKCAIHTAFSSNDAWPYYWSEFCVAAGCTDPEAANYDPEATVDDGSCFYCDLGDVNCDGNLNILDLVQISNMILDNSYDVIADFNQDGQVNILDLVQIVNCILTDCWGVN